MGRENHERCSKKNIPKIGGYLIMIIENKIGGGGGRTTDPVVWIHLKRFVHF